MRRLLPLLVALGIVAALGLGVLARTTQSPDCTDSSCTHVPVIRRPPALAPSTALPAPTAAPPTAAPAPTAAPEPTAAPPTAAPAPTSTPFVVGFLNGNFELGHAVWIEIPGNALITKFSGVGALSGQWLAHFEGLQNTHPELQQEITLPNAPVYLYYYRQMDTASDVSGMDSFSVLANTTELEHETLGPGTETGGQWVAHTINLSAYANQTVTIRFRLDQRSDQRTDVYADDVHLSSSP